MNNQQKSQKNTTYLIALLLIVILIPIINFSKEVVKINETQITDNVIVYNIEGLQSTNITVIDTDKGLVVIDSETSPVFADVIRKNIEETHEAKSIRYLINTHDHGDHTYGNQVFANATIIGHDRCKEEMIKNQKKAGQTKNQITNALKSMKMKLESLDKNSDAAREIQKVIDYYEPIAKVSGKISFLPRLI